MNRFVFRKFLVLVLTLPTLLVAGITLTSTPANAAVDNTLTDLRISSATLNQTFSATTYSYSASLNSYTNQVQVTPTFIGAGETATVNGVLTNSDSSTPVTLVNGINSIQVVAWAPDGSSNTYTVSITLYTITYNLNGATSGSIPVSETVTVNSSYTVAFNTGLVKRTDFQFLGWSDDPSDGANNGNVYRPGTGSLNITGNITLYAKWDNPYGFGLYLDKPFVQNSYIYSASDTSTALETANLFTTASGGAAMRCPDTFTIGTITNAAGCSVYSTGIYGGASNSVDATPTIGGSGSTFMNANANSPFTINFPAPQAYFGMWWSASSPSDTIRFYSGTKLLATMTTSSLVARLEKTSVPTYPHGTLTAPDNSTTRIGYYYGNPIIYSTLTPPSLPGSYTNDPQGNTYSYTTPYAYAYIHAFGSGGVTFDKVSLGGGQFEFDNLVTSTAARTPAAYLIKDQFVGSTYYVTYDRNGSSSTAIADQGSTVPANITASTYSRAGFTFGGWNTKADGTGRTLASSAQYAFDNNITLYALWTPMTVTAAKNIPAGGTVTASDANNDGTWNLVATPASGYTFSSWSCSPSQTVTTATSATASVIPSADATCTATFTLSPTPTPTPTASSAPEPASPPAPSQSSRITNAPDACNAGSTYQISGEFDIPITNISLNGQLLNRGDWIQSATKIVITLPATVRGELSFQIYNGAYPLLREVRCSGSAAPTPVPSSSPSTKPTPTASPSVSPSASPQPTNTKSPAAVPSKSSSSENSSSVKSKSATMAFDIFYNMNSATLDSKNKSIIKNQLRELRKKLSPNSDIRVEVTGWVQPTAKSPNVEGLSFWRAKSVVLYLQSLGLTAKYVVEAPGHEKVNIAESRRASTVIFWSNPKE